MVNKLIYLLHSCKRTFNIIVFFKEYSYGKVRERKHFEELVVDVKVKLFLVKA